MPIPSRRMRMSPCRRGTFPTAFTSTPATISTPQKKISTRPREAQLRDRHQPAVAISVRGWPQPRLAALRGREPEVLVGGGGGPPPSRRAREKPALEQERLDDLLQRFGLFVQRRRQRIDPHRTAAVHVDQGAQQLPVEAVQARPVPALA